MIDAHCHILPGVDHGSPDLETSVEMLQAAKGVGIETIVATPHLYSIDSAYIGRAERAYRELLPIAREMGIRLERGFEVNYRVLVDVKLTELQDFCRANTRELLLELPEVSPFPNMADYMKRLAEMYKVTIAHPERVSYYKREAGCEVLISATSLRRHRFFGVGAVARKYLKAGERFASDAHSPMDYQWYEKAKQYAK